MTTLTDIEQRAQRMLDGMTVNRERFAQDVLDLIAAIRKARPEPEVRMHSPNSDFRGAFDDIFGSR